MISLLFDEKFTDYTWVLVVNFIFAFLLAFGLGANDVGNSFATSVGAKVLTLRNACIIAAIAEFSGSVILGARVTETVSQEVANPMFFEDNPEELMIGMMTATASTSIWILIATYLKLPVSVSHSIISAIIGFALVAEPDSIQWKVFTKILISWVVSPILSGIISVLIYVIIRKFITRRPDSFETGLKAVPIIYGITILINISPVIWQFFELGYKNSADPPLNIFIIVSIVGGVSLGLLVSLGVHFIAVPKMRDSINQQYDESKLIEDEDPYYDQNSVNKNEEKKDYGTVVFRTSTTSQFDFEKNKTEKLFSFLQILTATFASFAHGSNDVSNAVGPLLSTYSIWKTSNSDVEIETPIWLLAYGGFGIVVGLSIWGRKVIETIGTNLTEITPSRGFTIEIGSALTVLIASIAKIPVSTTHCKVGSVMAVGYFSNDGYVSWILFAGIVFSWAVTIPLSGLISAGLYFAIRSFV